MNFKVIFEKKNRRWLFIGAAVVLFIVLLSLLRPRSNGANAAVSSGPSEAFQAEQLRASNEAYGMQAQLQASMSQTQAQLQVEQLRAANEALAITTSLDALQIQAQGADRASQRQYELSLASLAAERDVTMLGISSQTMIAQANIDAGLERERIAAESMIAQQSLFIQGQVGLEQARSATEIAHVQAARDVAIQQDETMRYAISRAKKKHVPQFYGGAGGSSIGSQIGGVVGSLGGLFSDIRRKRNILPTGERVDGIPTYSYELVGAPGKHAGVMAQELERMAPQFVLHTPRGLLVDYTGLDANT